MTDKSVLCSVLSPFLGLNLAYFANFLRAKREGFETKIVGEHWGTRIGHRKRVGITLGKISSSLLLSFKLQEAINGGFEEFSCWDCLGAFSVS